MKPTRPTLRVLNVLPTNPSIAVALSVIARAKVADRATAAQILQELRLYEVKSALLDDADRGFANGGTPSRHEAASSVYDATVYEVRDHEGAGWRGAVTLDDEGNPWLVFADRHNQFHATVAKALKRDKGELKRTGNTKGPAASYEPTQLDHVVRGYEDSRLQDLKYQRDLVTRLRNGLREANDTASVVSVRTPDDPDSALDKFLEYTVEVAHDEPADTAEEANLSTSTVTLTLPMDVGSYRGYETVVSCGAIYVQPDVNYHEYVYTNSSTLRLDLCVTHAKLAQILSDAEIDDAVFPPSLVPPDRLHWVHSPQHIEGIVTGSAVRGLCGGWFVPVLNESAELPVCDGCESILPLAQEMLDQLRLRAQS
ncbi:DUF3039 domain-containing protein [Arthrobacter sp. BE255]|uniref:DUF3039 domain-containing protein n=1 Tax=Arthrobacter sp. BE255 TaxID=2817721 RepID=UPI00285F454A|nr:DUF3039 domain-containing protein [Arthrobacter sp. BE255]MDR7161404.1 hypothetical protein [Arthrobacter sp. BE255]